MNKTKAWRLSLAFIFAFGWLLSIPTNAYATCVNYLQSQTIAAAYNGDEEPTVHEMDTCSGDDISYQIPIASTITFDGVEYDTIYATTNSVITFGQPDPTYWTYPQTPSISLYSMDWYPGANNTSGLFIYYSEGGFQINIEAVPFGQWNAQPSNINILVAITNTGSLAVSYSYQGPEYQGLRTGVRLHDGSIVSLEDWGATQIQAGDPLPSLSPEPVSEPTPTPSGPTQEEIRIQQEIFQLNQSIANIVAMLDAQREITPTPTPTVSDGSTATITPIPQPTIEPTPVPSETPSEGPISPVEPSPVPSPTPESPKPSEEPSKPIDEVIIVEPEIITPEDPEFPDIIIVPEPKPEEIENLTNIIANLTNKNNILSLTPEQKFVLANSLGIKTEEIKLVAQLASENTNIAEALSTFENRAAENKDAPMPYTLADATTEVQAEHFLENPIGAFINIDLKTVLSPSEWGKDMTDDQREKAQEVIVPVIIASNIVAAAMTRRK